MRLRNCAVCAVLLIFTCVLWGQSPKPPVTFDRILNADSDPANWLTYSRTVLGQRFSPLTEITPTNVKDLEIAWLRQVQSDEKFEATPLVADGVLYTVQPPNDVIALDAATGRVRWTYHHAVPPVRVCCGRVNRGLAILGDTLFMGTLDAHLLAINAETGQLVWDRVVADATDPSCQNPQRPNRPEFCYAITHAPLVVKDRVIVGTAGGDTANLAGYGVRSFIAAYDSKTGKEVWRFMTVPGPGQPGNETWSGDSWKNGGAGVWNTGSYDSELNLTYWGTGNPSPFGATSPPEPIRADARLGDNLYSASVVALDADTGTLKWHYQFTPHDDMDWDAAQVPVLADLDWQGRHRKVLLFANKNGLMYVLDRVSGQFLMAKKFVEINWLDRFNEKGAPLRVPGKVSTNGSRVLPFSGTNWYPQSYSPNTGLYYIPAWERGSEWGVAVGGTSRGALVAFDPRSGERKW